MRNLLASARAFCSCCSSVQILVFHPNHSFWGFATRREMNWREQKQRSPCPHHTTRDRRRGYSSKLCQGKLRLDIWRIPAWKGLSCPWQPPFLGGFNSVCGTRGRGLGWPWKWLDSVTSEGFSKLNNSIISWMSSHCQRSLRNSHLEIKSRPKLTIHGQFLRSHI